MRTLSADRQVAAVTEAAIGTDFDEPLDAHLDFLAQIAFHQSLALDDLTDAIDLVLAQVLDLLHRVHIRLVKDASGARLPNAVNVSQRHKRPLVTGKIDACNSSHVF